MIIWIDGPSGIGKSSIANRLVELLEGWKAEHLDTDACFQKWGDGNLRYYCSVLIQDNLAFFADLINTIGEKIESNAGLLIVSMALTTDRCRDMLYAPIAEKYNAKHFILTALEDEIIARIDADHGRDKGYAKMYLRSSMDYLEKNYPDATRISTSGKSIEDVALYLLEQLKLLGEKE